jgi:Xaa-Pro aminopeptidase
MTLQSAPATTARLERLRAAFDDHRINALLVTDPNNRRYLSGFTGSAGTLLVTRDAAQIATDFRYWEQVESQCPSFALSKSVGTLGEWLPELLRPNGGTRIGIESGNVSVELYRQFREVVEGLPAGDRPELVPVAGVVEALRAIKEPEEVAQLERVIKLADAAFDSAVERIEPGWTEKQVAWEIEKYVRTHGGDGMSFQTIVAGGPAGAMPHARARDVALKPNQGVVIDMGALLDGYCSDMTRTVFLGEPDAQFKKVYDIVLAAQLAAEEMIEDGMDGNTAHMLAMNVIAEAGYGENFGHGLGHGIGLQVHEDPYLRRGSKDVLRNGMVFSVEPGIYITEWGGVRIEDLCVLENGRCRVLTTTPKLRFIGV